MTFMHLHTCEMLRTQDWGSLALGKHRRTKLAKLEKNASFALCKTNSFCRATRNYMQFCNRMCLLVTGTWRRRDHVSFRECNRDPFSAMAYVIMVPVQVGSTIEPLFFVHYSVAIVKPFVYLFYSTAEPRDFFHKQYQNMTPGDWLECQNCMFCL